MGNLTRVLNVHRGGRLARILSSGLAKHLHGGSMLNDLVIGPLDADELDLLGQIFWARV